MRVRQPRPEAQGEGRPHDVGHGQQRHHSLYGSRPRTAPRPIRAGRHEGYRRRVGEQHVSHARDAADWRRHHLPKVYASELEECDAIIGMDIINLGHFHLDLCQGETTFSFSLPNE